MSHIAGKNDHGNHALLGLLLANAIPIPRRCQWHGDERQIVFGDLNNYASFCSIQVTVNDKSKSLVVYIYINKYK